MFVSPRPSGATAQKLPIVSKGNAQAEKAEEPPATCTKWPGTCPSTEMAGHPPKGPTKTHHPALLVEGTGKPCPETSSGKPSEQLLRAPAHDDH